MPSRQVSNLRPLWRFRHPLNKQKVTNGEPPPQKDVKNEGRSGKVYENKGSHDKLTERMSDICLQLKPILQKIAGLDGQFSAIYALGACFLWIFTATSDRSATCLIAGGAYIESNVGAPRRSSGRRVNYGNKNCWCRRRRPDGAWNCPCHAARRA